MLYTGLDLHKSFSYITIMNDRGEVISQKKLPSNGEILDFLKGFGDSMEVAIEATPSWYWLYDCLEDEGLVQKPCQSCRLTLELTKPKVSRI